MAKSRVLFVRCTSNPGVRTHEAAHAKMESFRNGIELPSILRSSEQLGAH